MPDIPEEDRSRRDDESFFDWLFRVKPYTTARNRWIDEHVKWDSTPIKYHLDEDDDGKR